MGAMTGAMPHAMNRAAMALRRACAAALLGLLAACAQVPPQTGAGEPPPGVATARNPPLQPLARQAGTPADAPRSRVPLAVYDLGLGSADDELPPDDGVPGDEPPGEVFQRGGASYYGIPFHRRLTANGERYDMWAMTAAHRTLRFDTRVCVRSLVNGKEVLVRINDRGPYVSGRIIDLSQAAAERIGMIDLGIKQVLLSLVEPQGGRCAGAAVPPLEAKAKDDDAPRRNTAAAPSPKPANDAKRKTRR